MSFEIASEMANPVEGDNKERLNNSEFCELIPHLKWNDLLLIEYRNADKWSRLFKVTNSATKACHCNLCGVPLGGLKTLVAHIEGKKHKLQMKSVKQLFHHEYTYLKTEGDMAVDSTSEDPGRDPESNHSAMQKTVSSEATVDLLDFTITYENYEPKITDTIAIMRKSNAFESNMNEKQEESDHEIGLTKAAASEQAIQSTSTQIIGMKNKDNPLLTISEPNDMKESSADTIKTICPPNESKKPESIQKQSFNKIKINYQSKNTTDNNLPKKVSNQLVDSTKNTGTKTLTTLVNPTRKSLKTPSELAKPATTNRQTANIAEAPQAESHERPSYKANIVVTPSKYKKIACNETAPINDQPRFTSKSWDLDIHNEQLHALLGVEYVIKILKYKDDKSPKYECSLCELILEGRAMQNHLIGYNHRLKYCEKHFPTAVHQFRLSIDNIPVHEEFKVLGPILAKLARAVEDHHGRELPFESMERDFNQNRQKIFLEVFSRRHASEQNGPSFTNVVDAKEIDQFILNRHTYKPPLVYVGPSTDINARVKLPPKVNAPVGLNPKINYNMNQDMPVSFAPINPPLYPANIPYMNIAPQPVYQSFPAYPPIDVFPQTSYANTQVDDETHRLMVESFLETNKKHSSSSHRQNTESRHSQLRRTSSRAYVSYRSPERKRQKSHSKLDSRSEHTLAEIEKLFQGYRENPESHPMYNEEWQKFWNRRKNELIAAGLDHRTHNYQPEWVNFLKVRIEQLYQEALENVKGPFQEKPAVNRESSNQDISDPFDSSRMSTLVAPAVIENSLESEGEVSYAANTTVVSVLRFLTALEEYLGSLGPKIIELLSKALQAEKNCPEKINAIMLTIENCTLLETAKEKFKGLVIAEFLDSTKERVLKKAIKEVESLLQIAEKERKANNTIIPCRIQEPVSNTSNMRRAIVEPVYDTPLKQQLVQNQQNPNISVNRPIQTQANASNPAISNFLAQADKKELALKLAAAISAQGKTDCDPEQLQQLLAVYALMEKKKREASEAQNLNIIGDKPAKKNQKTLSDTLTDFLNPSATTNQVERPNYGIHAHDLQRLIGANNANQNLVAQSNDTSMWQNLQNIFKGSQNGMPKKQNLQNTNQNFQNVAISDRNTFNPNAPMSTLRGKESYAIPARIEQNAQNFNQSILDKDSNSRNNFSTSASMNTFSLNERFPYNASNNSGMQSTNNTFDPMGSQRTDNNMRGGYGSQQQQYRQPTFQQRPFYQTQQQQTNLGTNQLWNTDNPSRNNSFTGNQLRNNTNTNESNFQSLRSGNLGHQY